MARIDDAAVRNTRDVDILLRREDLDRAREAMERAGFVYRHAKSLDMFLDGPDSKARDAVHVVFARERVHPTDVGPTADVTESEPAAGFRVVSLEALVRMKLTSFRRKDQVHVEDMLDVGLIDESWYGRLPEALADRLREILEAPDR